MVALTEEWFDKILLPGSWEYDVLSEYPNGTGVVRMMQGLACIPEMRAPLLSVLRTTSSEASLKPLSISSGTLSEDGIPWPAPVRRDTARFVSVSKLPPSPAKRVFGG